MSNFMAVYKPGDPWETIEHFQRALTGPFIEHELGAAGDMTPESYFEHRQPSIGCKRCFTFHVEYASGSGNFLVTLERSLDHGQNWGVVETFDQALSKDVHCDHLAKFRAKAESLDPGTKVTVRLYQNL